MQTQMFTDIVPKNKLPTNLTTEYHPIHRWFNFIAGFSPEFVKFCIQDADLTRSHFLIDPFAGLSTSLVQASLEGIESIGFEPHPFFHDISRAKIDLNLTPLVINQIKSYLLQLQPFSGEFSDIWSESACRFLTKLIPLKELRILAEALLLEQKLDEKLRPIYRLIVSRILELASTSQTDGIYKAPTTLKKSIDFYFAVDSVCTNIIEDIYNTSLISRGKSELYLASSENMSQVESESCSICVTSPPYLNNFDFAEMTRMEFYYWIYATSWRDITESVRRKLVVNTTTVPNDIKKSQTKFRSTLPSSLLKSLEPLVSSLSEMRQIHAGKKEYDLLVFPYFSQMHTIFQELRRVLKYNSPFHLVVADSALYGIHIETQQLLASLMKETGFRVIQIESLRKRGDRWILEKRKGSKKGLGEYHIVSRRL